MLNNHILSSNMSQHTIISKKYGVFTVLVDSIDDDLFTQHKYCVMRRPNGKFVPQRGITRKDGTKTVIFLHREIAARMGFNVNSMADHRSRDTLDNRRENLRPASQHENGFNRSLRSDNTSGVTGVYFVKHLNKWCAYIQRAGVRLQIGTFENKQDAIGARISKAKQLFGKFTPHSEVGE